LRTHRSLESIILKNAFKPVGFSHCTRHYKEPPNIVVLKSLKMLIEEGEPFFSLKVGILQLVKGNTLQESWSQKIETLWTIHIHDHIIVHIHIHLHTIVTFPQIHSRSYIHFIFHLHAFIITTSNICHGHITGWDLNYTKDC
jgi:hypothetical protein